MEIVSPGPKYPLLIVSYSLEFSNCARTAIMCRVSEDVAKSRVGEKVCGVERGSEKRTSRCKTETRDSKLRNPRI